MSEKVSEEIKQVVPGDEFRICLACGYVRGFHVFFLPDDNEHRIVLISPNCRARPDASSGKNFKPKSDKFHSGESFAKRRIC